MAFLYLILVSLLCFMWRIVPLLGMPHGGCDSYYFLLCREEFRKRKKIPIVLPPYYVLEYQEQWYPPGFCILLATIPERILNRLYWCISPAVDALICCGVFLFIYFHTNSAKGAALGSLIYLMSPAAIAETQSLTSRQLGSLFLALTAVSGILYVTEPHIYFLILCIIFGVLLLLTHKLSTQAFYFSFILMALLTGEIAYIFLVFIIVLSTIVFSKGYYFKIVRSHVDYILFWSKRWRYLGGHQIYDSPVYRKEEYEGTLTYKKGIGPKIQFLRIYFEDNVYFIVLCAILISFSLERDIAGEYLHFALWSLVILAIGFLSYIVPMFRGIGFVSQYGKLALPVGVICTGYCLQDQYLRYFAYMVFGFSLYQGGRYLRNILVSTGREEQLLKWDIEKLDGTFEFLRTLGDPLVMCIPNNYSDLVAYHCRIRVLWGTHGSPTKMFESIVPVLFEPLEKICQEHLVTHLLIDTRHTIPSDLGIYGDPCWQDGYISIYEVHNGTIL